MHNKFYEAFHYLLNHPYFKGEFVPALEIEVVKVNPETDCIDDDRSKNTDVRVWLECGTVVDSPSDCFCSRYSHNYLLDCGGNTFEEAIIRLAALVQENYPLK